MRVVPIVRGEERRRLAGVALAVVVRIGRGRESARRLAETVVSLGTKASAVKVTFASSFRGRTGLVLVVRVREEVAHGVVVDGQRQVEALG